MLTGVGCREDYYGDRGRNYDHGRDYDRDGDYDRYRDYDRGRDYGGRNEGVVVNYDR